jgi:CubicO group peptidase (beta-lactamase class C family)
MLGRLPWFALLRRRRALRFLVFFDMRARVYGRRSASPTPSLTPMSTPTTASIEGTCDPRFTLVRQAFRANFDTHGEVGASVAVTLGGHQVVDLWGGTCTTDAGPDQPWQADTIINVWSCTKTMAFLVILMLADQGLLDLDAPVADVWPEFGANGKQQIDVKQVMSHSAGLSGWEVPGTADELADWELMTSRLAAQAPWWEPGDRSGYHAITQGYLLGEICRRATGSTIGQWFAEHVARPLGADFHIGTPPVCDPRVAHVIPVPDLMGGAGLREGTIPHRTFMSMPLTGAESSTIEWRRAEIPAAGGHGNARSMARVMAVLANRGELDGRRYLSEAMCERIFEEQQNGRDRVLLRPLRFGLGFGLRSDAVPLPNDRSCYWTGWGGSLALVDMENRISIAYAMSSMRHNTAGDPRPISLALATFASVV